MHSPWSRSFEPSWRTLPWNISLCWATGIFYRTSGADKWGTYLLRFNTLLEFFNGYLLNFLSKGELLTSSFKSKSEFRPSRVFTVTFSILLEQATEPQAGLNKQRKVRIWQCGGLVVRFSSVQFTFRRASFGPRHSRFHNSFDSMRSTWASTSFIFKSMGFAERMDSGMPHLILTARDLPSRKRSQLKSMVLDVQSKTCQPFTPYCQILNPGSINLN